MTYSVHDEPDFERVYDEDGIVQVRRGDLRALLDLATESMNFSSGFWCEEETEIARGVAELLGIEPGVVTPTNMKCKYEGKHDIRFASNWAPGSWHAPDGPWYCDLCGTSWAEEPA